MNELFLFVRPPRPLWPFNGPSSAFWPPLAFASMAAMLRERAADLRVEILDAPAVQMGWRSLELEIYRRKPVYVGIGEEAVSCVEGLRLARLAKGCGALVIAGGCFFGNVAKEVIATGLVDVVVHGEGELTVVELVEALRGGSWDDLGKVNGISYLQKEGPDLPSKSQIGRTGAGSGLETRDTAGWKPAPQGTVSAEKVVTTPPRALLPNLDDLPFPAYDLLPVERYGAGSINHPHLAAVELGRGCFGSCSFCVLWRQMGKMVGEHVAPQLRVKSPERVVEEVKVLVRRYGRRYLGWVDPCFNAHPEVPGRVAELMLREGLRIGQSAWVRADAVVRDARSGALANCVASGLNELYLGFERPDRKSLAALHKTGGADDAQEAMRILKQEHPEVLAIGSFIYGLPGDTPATIRAIHQLSIDLGLDQFFFIPLTPLPGTSEWRPELWDGTGERFREFNFLPTGHPHGHYAELERALLWSLLCNWSGRRVRAHLRHWFGSSARKRRVHRRLDMRVVGFHLRRLIHRMLGGDDVLGLIFPKWYEQ